MTALALPPLALTLMAPSAGNQGLQTLFIYGVLFLVFWMVFIVPQQRQRKEHEKRVTELKRGDEVVTTGGVIGEVVHIKEGTKDGQPVRSMDDRITLKSGETRLVVERRSIARVVAAQQPAATT